MTDNRCMQDEIREVCRLAVNLMIQGTGIGQKLLEVVKVEGRITRIKFMPGVLEQDVDVIRLCEKPGWQNIGQSTMVGQNGTVWKEHFYIHGSASNP